VRFVNFNRHLDAQPSLDRYRGLIVLGGPMNVDQQDQYPHLKVEMRLIEEALRQNKPVLGICLGAQLLAHVLGAPIRRLPQAEIGWYSLRPTAAAASDPVLGVVDAPHPIFQWHECGFDLPNGAQLLASTDTCTNQAFRYGEDAWGFQFHMEVDTPLIHRWLSIPGYHKQLRLSGLPHGPDEIRQQTEEHMSDLTVTADQVFNRFLDRIGRPRKRLLLPSR
jgi:GMP synthase (glutamine-hydrolysing)